MVRELTVDELAEEMSREAKLKKWNHIFIFTNTVIFILSISMMCLMLSLESYWYVFEPFLSVYRDIHGLGVITTGSAICICTCLGYLIACSQKSTHFIWYGLGILLLIILDIRVIVNGLVKDDFVSKQVNRTMYTGLLSYENSTRFRRAVDITQLSLMCCGVQNYTDWNNTPNGFIPYSCCPMSTDLNAVTGACQPDDDLLFKDSCHSKLVEVPEIGVMLLYCVVTILVSIKTLCLILTVKMERLYKYNY